jgi:hypothetical protein
MDELDLKRAEDDGMIAVETTTDTQAERQTIPSNGVPYRVGEKMLRAGCVGIYPIRITKITSRRVCFEHTERPDYKSSATHKQFCETVYAVEA